MASKRGFSRQFLISGRHKETAYNTPTVGTVQLMRANSEPWSQVPELVPDLDQVGGLEEVTGFDTLSQDVNIPTLSFNRVKPHPLAAFASYALGAVSTSTVDTSGKKHAITPVSVFELDSFTVEEILIAGTIQNQFPGCMVNSIELSMARKGWIEMAVDIIASGAKNVGSATGTEISGEPALKAGDCKFIRSTGAYDGTTEQSKSSMDLGATITDLSAKTVNFRWKYNNNIAGDDLYRLNSGLYRGIAERDRRSQEFTTTVELQDATEFAALTAGTKWSIELECMSTVLAGAATIYHGFNLILPIVQIKTATPTGGVGKLLVDLDMQVMQDATLGSVVLDVYNTVASYLA